jgi:hypothetical protein
MAVSRRASKSLPAQAPSSSRRPSSGTTGTGWSGTIGGFIRAIGAGGDLVLLLQPSVQDPQPPVAGGDRLRCSVLEQLAEEGLQVLAAGVQEAAAAAGQERLGLAEAFQVAGDGVLGAVLGP